MQLRLLDLVVIVLYLALTLGVGIYFARRQTSKESYFVSDRQMPWYLVGISVFATLLSTMTYLSIPGEMIRYGVGYFFAYLGFIAAVPLVNRLIIPYLMRLPVTSVYEYLEKRYGVEARSLAAGVFVVTRVIWIGLVTYTASFAISAITGWGIPVIALIIAGVAIFFATAGGITAVIWMSVVKFVILFGGAILVPVYILVLTGSGPGEWWAAFSQAGRATVPVFSFDATVRITILGMVILQITWNMCTHGADQVAAQRYLTTDSAKSAARSVWLFALANVGLIGLLAVCGLGLFFYNYSISGLTINEFQTAVAPDADNLLPRFIATRLPVGIAGLLLAALISAAMTSVGSGVNSISTVLVTDFFDRFRTGETERNSLVLARSLTVTAGLLGFVAAVTVDYLMQASTWNLVELIERANHLFVAPLAALFFAGLFFRRTGTRAAMLGFFAGILTSFLVSFSGEIFGVIISFMWIMPASLLVSMLVAFGAGFLLDTPSAAQLSGLSLTSQPAVLEAKQESNHVVSGESRR
jgi:solute:Na+ symporter, SSS family